MLLQKALRLDEAARFEPCLLHAKELRDNHIKCMGCFRARHRLLIGGVLPIRYRAKQLTGFFLGLVKANFWRASQCHAALFWTDLVLHNVSSVFSLSAIAAPQPEARHAIV